MYIDSRMDEGTILKETKVRNEMIDSQKVWKLKVATLSCCVNSSGLGPPGQQGPMQTQSLLIIWVSYI